MDDKLRLVVERLESRRGDLGIAIVERIRDQVSELDGLQSAQLWRVLKEQTEAALSTELSYLKHGGEIPSSAPPDAAEAARLAAGAGVPLMAILRMQRIGHSVVASAYLEEVERLGLDRAERRALTDVGSRFLFSYADALANFTEEEHRRELKRVRHSTVKQQLRVVMEILYGGGGDGEELGYPIDGEHVGVIGWGRDPRAAVRALAGALDRRLLTVEAPDGTLWGWLGGQRQFDERCDRTLAAFQPNGCFLAFGEPAGGLDGFRRTHRQAHEAHRVALRRPLPLTRYAEVALEALALTDERAAEQFVELQLGPLGRDDRGHILRATLRAYFAYSQNAAATAAGLGIHEQTVAQRLRAVEERIGRPVSTQRAELETALRIEELLRPSHPDSPQVLHDANETGL